MIYFHYIHQNTELRLVWENKKAKTTQPQAQTDFNTQHFQVLQATLASFAPVLLADENIPCLLLPNPN